MLREGDKAPAFELESDAGKPLRLADFAGTCVVVYFYPRDNTPGCTREAQAFSARMADLTAAGAKVVGISKDSIASHCKFRDKYGLAFPLLSDPDLSVHKAYGAFGEKMMYGKKVEGVIRSTFIVGSDGRVMKVFPNVRVDGHAEAVLTALRADDDDANIDESPGRNATKRAGARSAAPKPMPKAGARTTPRAPAKGATGKRVTGVAKKGSKTTAPGGGSATARAAAAKKAARKR